MQYPTRVPTTAGEGRLLPLASGPPGPAGCLAPVRENSAPELSPPFSRCIADVLHSGHIGMFLFLVNVVLVKVGFRVVEF